MFRRASGETSSSKLTEISLAGPSGPHRKVGGLSSLVPVPPAPPNSQYQTREVVWLSRKQDNATLHPGASSSLYGFLPRSPS